MNRSLRLYFLCVQNRCRSQIAEGFAKYYGGDKVNVESAGIESTEVHPLAIEVMKEIGIDISQQVSKKLNMKSFMSANIVVKTCNSMNEKCPIVPFGIQNVQWDIPDPVPQDGSLGNLDEFRKTRDLIKEKVIQLLKEKQVIASNEPTG